MKTIILVLLCFPQFAIAQLNESDSLAFKANLSTTGFWQDGNVETLIFRAKSEVSVKPTDKIVFKSQNSYVYQEFGKSKADEDILSLNFLYFDPQKRLYPLLLGFVSTNFRREIDLRSIVGGGATYQIVDNEKDWLKFSLSGEYEQTDFASVDFNKHVYDGERSINTFRATAWINGEYHIFDENLILSHLGYYQPSLQSSDNFRWQADIGLELPIWKFLNFKTNYLHTFESIVIEGQEQEDRFLTFGLSLKSY